MERKDFLKAACALCGLAVVPALLIESCTKQSFSGPTNVNFTIDLSNAGNAALLSVGGSLVQNSVIVIHASTGYIALSDVCTHQGCAVGYDAGSTHIICPCHGGVYDINGAVLSGPPPGALTKYTVTQSGTVLTVRS
jgi:cytochrome b6-f complex iron-sulfur subunit